MNKLDSQLQTPRFTVDRFSPPAHRQFIVLIPDDLNFAAIRRVWNWANAAGAHIQLLSLYHDAAQEPALRRRLVTIVSLLQHGNVSADLRVEWGTNWVEAVKRNSHLEDVLVCFAEQRAGLLHRPLSQILQANLKNPVYILSDLSPQNPPRSSWPLQMMAWVGSLGVIAGALVLQIQIVSMTQGWLETTLLILSTLLEAWLIGVWNSLF